MALSDLLPAPRPMYTNLSWSQKIFCSVGIATIAYFVGNFYSSIYLHFIRRSKLHRYLREDGSAWALVTGSSDGIGKGFAEELCSRGFNVLLHGRNQAKLEMVMADLMQRFPKVMVLSVTADATKASSADIDNLLQTVQTLPGKLTVLVNNIGGVPFQPQYASMTECGEEMVDNIVNINARFPTQVARALLPTLRANSPSLVLSMGSITGLQGPPYLVAYSASKAYNHTFSEALSAELAAEHVEGVEVMTILTGVVNSAGNPSPVNFFTPTSRRMAAAALDKSGCGKRVVFGYWAHALQWTAVTMIPYRLREAILIKALRSRKAEEVAESRKTH
ncbi:hypothetical protein LTR50_003401 [Elasticomyces elasticus]|nr:hypothetical protein LTR50_003401 [Elasticomyces elasticus]